jgi:hypothetical protein
MGLLKEGKLELLKIQKALASVGYYALSADMLAGQLIETIHVCPFNAGHDALIRRDEEVLAVLPDNADFAAWREAYLKWGEDYLKCTS